MATTPSKKKGKSAASSAAVAAVHSTAERIPPRLRERYRNEIAGALSEQFGYRSPLQVPRLRKVTLNFGLGEAVGNPAIVTQAIDQLSVIAGQKAVTCRAKKSIANFKLREGQAIGAMVTLRGERMWEFLDRLISVAMPRIRDFQGVGGTLDGHGNYTFGLREQIIFHEIDYDKVSQVKGLNVTVTTTATSDAEGKALLKALGMPFRR